MSLPPASSSSSTPGTTAPASTEPGRGALSEEASLLQRVRARLLSGPPPIGASEAEIVAQLVVLQRDLRECKTEDKGSFTQQIEQLTYLLDQLRAGKPEGEIDPESPYFGHLRLIEDGRARDICIGKATRLENGLRIVDWRNAPISRLFYRYTEGDDYLEEMNGRMREGVVDARRTVNINQGELWRVGAPDGSWVRERDQEWSFVPAGQLRLAGGEGSALRAGQKENSHMGSASRLRADKHLPDIAALIDHDQFNLITGTDSGVLVLRGSAGSGKTTVALHRIAYLCFDKPQRFRPDRILVVVWGRAMRDYVAHVLPALGVDGVQVTTWTDWARGLVRALLPRLPDTMADDTPEPVTRMKLHPGVGDLLADRIAHRRGKPTAEQVLEDWARTITDRDGIAAAMGEDLSPAALERVIRWTTEQTTAVLGWAEGETGGDARMDTEDDALLLRAWQLRVGDLEPRRGKPLRYAHILLDEVQDFSPVEVQVLLNTTDKHRCVTLAGDTRQHISHAAGFTSWTGFLDRIGIESKALSTLEVSYRSTHPITRFALDVLGDDDEPAPRTTRDGPPVELFTFTDHGAAVAHLSEELRALLRREPLANIALLTPDAGLSRTYAEGLISAEVPDVRLVIDQKFAFAAGIDVVEADQIKGLEFDYVIIVEVSARYWPDSSHHRRLMHVAATRAVHQLWLTCVGSLSPILPDAVR